MLGSGHQPAAQHYVYAPITDARTARRAGNGETAPACTSDRARLCTVHAGLYKQSKLIPHIVAGVQKRAENGVECVLFLRHTRFSAYCYFLNKLHTHLAKSELRKMMF
ncbi:hypothetical protein GPALN_003097 [Globodera pallida]|nr:hypothetical protein GPALN_003097 [Globodera pallida]